MNHSLLKCKAEDVHGNAKERKGQDLKISDFLSVNTQQNGMAAMCSGCKCLEQQ